MKYITEELYKKYQLFQLPLEDGITLDDLEALFEMDAHEFLLGELLARDEWYFKYLPESLRTRLFDKNGEVSFQELDESILDDIRQFRRDVELEWAKAAMKAKQERQQVKKTALPELKKLLDMSLADSEIRTIKGISTPEVVMELYPSWDLSKIITLYFKGVKNSWSSKLHPDDADWWLADEITIDPERADAYLFGMLFGNADEVGQVMFSFTEISIRQRDDLFVF